MMPFVRQDPGAAVSRDVTRLVRYIDEHVYDAHLSVKVLRAECGIRDHNVSCRFHHEMGATMGEYIHRARMRTASYMLRDPSISIVEVSYRVGYLHVQTFYRIFERRFGCTPGAYRLTIDVERGRAVGAVGAEC